MADNADAKQIRSSRRAVNKESAEETNDVAVEQEAEEAPAKLAKKKKSKKSAKILPNHETDEMKRMRKSILEKKLSKQTDDESDKVKVVKKVKKAIKADEPTDDTEPPKLKSALKKPKEVEEETIKKVKRAKETSPPEAEAKITKKKKLVKKKKKVAISEPHVHDVDQNHELDDLEAQQNLLDETNQNIENQEINDDQFHLKLDQEDSIECKEPASESAADCEPSTERVVSNVCAGNCSILTDDESNDANCLNKTYEKPSSTEKLQVIHINSPVRVLSCASFYKPNQTLEHEENQMPKPGDQAEEVRSQATEPKPRLGGARIVRPKQIVAEVKSIASTARNEPAEVVTKKVVEIGTFILI